MEAIMNLISTVGFPIGAYLLMWWTCQTTLKELKDAVNELKNAVNKDGGNLNG